MVDAYPLAWPAHKKRTPEHQRDRAKFGYRANGANRGSAISNLQAELDRLGARSPVVSSNLRLRLDGLPYADQRKPEDPGVAVYFTLNGQETCMACDKYDRDADNIHAIGKTIEAMRGIERWGSKEMMHDAFRGFKALPAPDHPVVHVPQYFDEAIDRDHLRAKYRRLAKEMHPDKGGNAGEFAEMIRQYKEANQRFEQ